MKPKNIDTHAQRKQAIVSCLITSGVRLGVLGLGIYLLHSGQHRAVTTGLLLLVAATAGIQLLFMPYLTWIRIKEIQGGELNEARKY